MATANAVTIMTRRDEAADWIAANPVLALGECGIEIDTDSGKYGDGVTDWINLRYAFGPKSVIPQEAVDVPYDGTASNLAADNVQAAIDEVVSKAAASDAQLASDIAAVSDAIPTVPPPQTAATVNYDPATSHLAATTVQAAIDEMMARRPLRNLLVNGNFAIRQRGGAFAAPAVHAYTADMWASGGNCAYNLLADAGIPPDGVSYRYMQIVPTAGNPAHVYTAVELDVGGGRPQPFIPGANYTLSFWAKAATPLNMTVAASFVDSVTVAANAVPVFTSAAIAITAAWQRFSVTFPINATPGANNIALQLYFRAQSNAVTVSLAEVQLEHGSIATPFEIVPLSEELMRCYRYYEQVTVPNTYLSAVSTGLQTAAVRFYQPKRIAAPVVTIAGSNLSGVATSASQHGFIASIGQALSAASYVVGSYTASAEL